jgi:hypothetical protein
VTGKINVDAVIVVIMKYFTLPLYAMQLRASTRIIAAEMAAILSSLY